MMRIVGFCVTWILGLIAFISWLVTSFSGLESWSASTSFGYIFLVLLGGMIALAISIGIIVGLSWLIWRPKW